jgi:hypothetical protein
MTHVGYLIAGWGIPLVGCAVYAVSVMRRAKRLAAEVPAERLRWMTGDDADVIGES